MKYLSPIPKQFVDQNGLPLSNGTVHVYISGDTQYANVYQDADGEELMPNPARLDSNGAWQGFVTAGVPLDYVVEDKNGNVQFSYQAVVAAQGGSGSQVAIEPVLTSGTKIAECWVDGELLELFAPSGGGGSQVQADWDESDTTNPAYIKNKPTIPSALSAGTGINISGSVISRKVQFVTTDSSYTYVRNIIDSGDLPVLKKSNGSMNDLFVCTMYRGSDIQFVGSAYGQTTLYNLASNNVWTSRVLEPQITAGNAGRVLAVNAAGTDAEWQDLAKIPSFTNSDRGKLLKVIRDGSGSKLAWGQPEGYVPWQTEWASGYTHNHTVTADEVSAGYFDMYQAFAADADTGSAILSPIRANLVWDTWCYSGIVTSNYVSSIDFAIGVDGGSYHEMFTDSAPAHEIHKDWFIYPNYLIHTRCNRIRIRYHLTANAVEGTRFQNEVSGLVDQVR